MSGWFVVVLLAAAGPALAAPPEKKQGAPVMADGDARFATQLYARLAAKPGNLFFSPASVRLALGMAYAGARGETAEQMRATLALPEGDAAHAGFAALLDRWATMATPKLHDSATRATDPGMQKHWEGELRKRTIVLRVVNRLWTQPGKKLRADYLERLKTSYRAAAAPVDFAKDPEAARVAINRWVSDQTEKKIPELIAPQMITAATRSVLTNAIYFKAQWQNAFEKQDTKPGDFFVDGTKKTSVPLMRQVDHFGHAKPKGLTVVELPYGDGKLAMDLLLPDAKDGLPALEKQLIAGALPGWLDKLATPRVDLVMPRWKVSSSFSVGDTLKQMGMALAFTFPGADFSGIDDSKLLFLSAVVHQAVVTVDEEGTEAAAATAVMMAAGGMPAAPIPVRVDHPFVFVIRDVESKAILFVGRVVDPR